MAGLRMSADGTRMLRAVGSKPDSWKKWEQRRPLVLRKEAADAAEAAYFTLNGRFLGTFSRKTCVIWVILAEMDGHLM